MIASSLDVLCDRVVDVCPLVDWCEVWKSVKKRFASGLYQVLLVGRIMPNSSMWSNADLAVLYLSVAKRRGRTDEGSRKAHGLDVLCDRVVDVCPLVDWLCKVS